VNQLKRLAVAGRARQQRRRLPDGSARVRPRSGAARAHVGQADGVGVEHRAAAVQREAVAVEIDTSMSEARSGDAFLQDARAFVDQREDAALDDLLIG
jgi:hypothetical protein